MGEEGGEDAGGQEGQGQGQVAGRGAGPGWMSEKLQKLGNCLTRLSKKTPVTSEPRSPPPDLQAKVEEIWESGTPTRSLRSRTVGPRTESDRPMTRKDSQRRRVRRSRGQG